MSNFSLFLHKSTSCFPRQGVKFNIKKLSEKDSRKIEVGRKNDIEGFSFKEIDFAKIHNRQKRLMEHCCGSVHEFIATPDYRLISGLGNASIYETSISLHHIYGCPFLPATSIKGIVRDYYLNEYIAPKASNNDLEAYAIKNSRTFCYLFGAPANNCVHNEKAMIGNIVFLDSLPTNSPKISIDVMTVHYKDYYGDGKLPPADWQEPNPIPFMTLKKEANHNHFAFFIGLRKGADGNIITDEGAPLFDFAKNLLEEALTNHGIGAKTAVGYGYMEPVKK